MLATWADWRADSESWVLVLSIRKGLSGMKHEAALPARTTTAQSICILLSSPTIAACVPVAPEKGASNPLDFPSESRNSTDF